MSLVAKKTLNIFKSIHQNELIHIQNILLHLPEYPKIAQLYNENVNLMNSLRKQPNKHVENILKEMGLCYDYFWGVSYDEFYGLHLMIYVGVV